MRSGRAGDAPADVGLCLDTGHIAVGGGEPLQALSRSDVDARLADVERPCQEGRLTDGRGLDL
jgi:sugar phosphate isomerase/epimerase